MKVRIYTLGCKVNQFESQAMLGMMEKTGWTAAGENEPADVTVINSCAVTAASEQKAVRLMHRIRREDPETVLVLTGCMAQTQKGEDSRLSEADIILGNKSREQLVPVLQAYFEDKKRILQIDQYGKQDQYESLSVDGFSERTRAFLKIEDGCNRFCSYCIIPYARGRVRSSTLEYIRQEMELFKAGGYREVVLVGINLSCYGQDRGLSMRDAVRTACSYPDMRIRLGSLEPESMDAETLRELAGFENFCPQFHLSLQSGCDETLRRMNRHYTTEEYSKIVSDILSIFDNPSITTDVMVGFAGETEEEFRRSMEFVEITGFARVHIFPYSRRPGTVADRLPEQVPQHVKKERAALMAQAAQRARDRFLSTQLGRVEKVLIETRVKGGLYEGYTPNYTLVRLEADESMVNTTVDVLLEKACGEFCLGRLT